MALADLEIVWIVTGSNLNAARPEFLVNILVRNYRDLSSDQGKDKVLADKILVTLVLRMNRDRGIAQKRFRSRRRDDDIVAAVLKIISDMPEKALILFIFDLRIGKCGAAACAPVDYSVAPVDESFIVKVAEGVADCCGKPFVHREALSFPVA